MWMSIYPAKDAPVQLLVLQSFRIYVLCFSIILSYIPLLIFYIAPQK